MKSASVLLSVLLLVTGCDKIAQQTTLIEATDAAKELVEQQLKSPSSAQWHEVKVLEQSRGYFLVYASVDSQNSFGAMLRNQFLVVCSAPDGHFQYNTRYAVQTCHEPPTDNEIVAVKSLNNWPK